VAGMAQATGQGLGLGPREVCGGPGPGQACRRAGAVGDAGVGPLRVDGLVSPRGGGANAVQPGQGADEPPEAPAARADCDTGQEVGACAALPAWLAPLGDGWPVWAEDAHGAPLGASRAGWSSWLRRARSPSRFNR